MQRSRLAIAFCLLVATQCCACSAGKGPVAARGFPSLARITRVASGPSYDFQMHHAGAGFAADLPANGCTADAGNVEFIPSWSDTAPNSLANAAYCIYRLTYSPQTPVAVSLDWDGQPPASSDCWIAL